MAEIETIELNGKKVPVEESKETICTGKIEVKGDVLTPESIKERIIELVHQTGVYNGDGSDLDISYDVDGKYEVKRIIKTPQSINISEYYKMLSLNEKSSVEEIASKLDDAVNSGSITREDADKLFEALAGIRHLREQIEEQRDYLNENLSKKNLALESGAKKENLKDYDEAVRQIAEIINLYKDEIKRIEENLPSIKTNKVQAVDETVSEETSSKIDDSIEVKELPAVITKDSSYLSSIKSGMTNENKDDKSLEEAYQELLDLREKLDKVNDNAEKLRLLKELIEKTEALEDTLSRTADLGDFRKAIQLIDDQIREIEHKLSEEEKEYESSFERLKKIVVEQSKELDLEKPLSEEDYNRLTNEYIAKKAMENAHSDYIKHTIEEYRRQLTALKRRKNALERDLKEASALGLSAKEYREITEIMLKRNLIKEVLERKGLKELVDIPAKERTKEQQKQLDEARAEIRREIARYLAEAEENVSVLDSIHILYGVDPKVTKVREPRKTAMSAEEINKMRQQAEEADVVKITNPDGTTKDNNNKEPLKAPEDMKDVKKDESVLGREASGSLVERITIFTDKNSGKKYTRKYIFNKFGITPHSEEVKINGSTCYELNEEDLKKITSDKNSYEVINLVIELELEKQKQFSKHDRFADDSVVREIENNFKNIVNNGSKIEDYSIVGNEAKEKITIYFDADNNEFYANKSVFTRFNQVELDKLAIIDGVKCYRMSQKAAMYIENNRNNSYSPYDIEIRKIHLGKNLNNVEETKVNEEHKETMKNEGLDNSSILTDKFTLYKDVENNGLTYVRKNVLARFNIKEAGKEVIIDGASCYPIRDIDADYIRRNKDNGYSPYIIEDKIVHFGKHKEEHKETKKNEGLDNSSILTDKFTLYKDVENNGLTYVRKNVLKRFNIKEAGKEVIIDGASCYPIRDIDADYIRRNKDNGYSPYIIEDKIVHFEKHKEDHKETRKIIIYIDKSTGKEFVSEEVLKQLYIGYEGTPTMIGGIKTHQIDRGIEAFIRGFAANSVNPKYEVIEKEIQRNKAKGSNKSNNKEIVLTLYRDTNNDNQIYASTSILNRFGIKLTDSRTRVIHQEECHKISPEIERIIINLAHESNNPKIKIEYKDVKLRKNKKPDKNKEVTYLILRDLTDKGLYACEEVINRFGINLQDKTPSVYQGNNYYKISEDMDKQIRQLVKEATNPKARIKSYDVRINKKKQEADKEEEKTYLILRDSDSKDLYASEETINRFGINLQDKTPTVYQGNNYYKISKDIDKQINQLAKEATNPKARIKYYDVHLKIKVSEEFAKELKAGQCMYNIIHKLLESFKAFYRDLNSEAYEEENEMSEMMEEYTTTEQKKEQEEKGVQKTL